MLSLVIAAGAALLMTQSVVSDVQEVEPGEGLGQSPNVQDAVEPVLEAAGAEAGEGTETRPISEWGDEVSFRRRFRSWSLGEYSGFLGTRFTSIRINNRRTNTGRVELRVETGVYEDDPMTIVCISQETRRVMGWIGFDRDDIVYACDFEQGGEALDRRFEMALKSSRFFGRTERAGEYQFGETVLRFEMGEATAGRLMSGTHPGYTVWQDDQVVGAIESGMMRVQILVPPEPGELRENVILLMAILMTYADPEEARGD